jgi:hypothetical protein
LDTLKLPIRCQHCGKRWFVRTRAALKLPGSLHQRPWFVRYLRYSYYVLSIAVSLAAFFASWEFCVEAWGAAGLILGWIPSAVLSTLMMLFLLGRGRHPKLDRPN